MSGHVSAPVPVVALQHTVFMATRLVHRDVSLAGTSMHYLDSGGAQPVVFLHGNPTSSYLWRSVLAHAEFGPRRVVAVDLIGMGRSGKPPIGYHLTDHVGYVQRKVETPSRG
jgi:haloalkane dehalogenase